MKFGRIVLQLNTHRLTKSYFRFHIVYSHWSMQSEMFVSKIFNIHKTVKILFVCLAAVALMTAILYVPHAHDPALSLNMFRRQLKTYFFYKILTICTRRIRDLLIMRYIN